MRLLRKGRKGEKIKKKKRIGNKLKPKKLSEYLQLIIEHDGCMCLCVVR